MSPGFAAVAKAAAGYGCTWDSTAAIAGCSYPHLEHDGYFSQHDGQHLTSLLKGFMELSHFLDFEVDGHRVIIFPASIKASLVLEPLVVDPEIVASLHLSDTPPHVYSEGMSVLAAKQRLGQHVAEYLGRST